MPVRSVNVCIRINCQVTGNRLSSLKTTECIDTMIQCDSDCTVIMTVTVNQCCRTNNATFTISAILPVAIFYMQREEMQLRTYDGGELAIS